MSRYKIDPPGVKAVLEATQAGAAESDTILKPLDGLVQAAVGAAFDLGSPRSAPPSTSVKESDCWESKTLFYG